MLRGARQNVLACMHDATRLPGGFLNKGNVCHMVTSILHVRGSIVVHLGRTGCRDMVTPHVSSSVVLGGCGCKCKLHAPYHVASIA